MPQPNEFLATVLKRGSAAFAGFAAADMLDTRPEAAENLGDPLSLWKEWLAARVDDLSAAVAAGKPDLFAQQVRWAASLFAAHNISTRHITEALEALRRVLEKELPDSTQALAEEYLSLAASAVDSAATAKQEGLDTQTEEGRLAATYLLALLEGDRRKAVSIVHEAASSGRGLADLYLQILAPALREIGRMWLDNEINIAEEHFATATTKMVMSQLRGREQTHPPNGKTVVAAAVSGNYHDVGLQMVADVFDMNGWRTIPLGANVPAPDLVQATQMFEADLLLISAALRQHLAVVRDTIQAVRQHSPTANTKILVGGTAFDDVADLAEQFGADGYAVDATEALQLGNRLVGIAQQ